MANVGHATADKYFVNLISLYFREKTRIVGVIGRTDNRLIDFCQINFNDCRVLCVYIRLK